MGFTIDRLEKRSSVMNLTFQQAVFTNFRPVFTVMFVILFVFFLLSLFKDGERKGINFSLILIVSIINIIIGTMIFFTESNIVETLSLEPDNLTLYLFMGVILLGVVNPLVYKLRNKPSSRYRYHRRF